jgi:hypothetical protein
LAGKAEQAEAATGKSVGPGSNKGASAELAAAGAASTACAVAGGGVLDKAEALGTGKGGSFAGSAALAPKDKLIAHSNAPRRARDNRWERTLMARSCLGIIDEASPRAELKSPINAALGPQSSMAAAGSNAPKLQGAVAPDRRRSCESFRRSRAGSRAPASTAPAREALSLANAWALTSQASSGVKMNALKPEAPAESTAAMFGDEFMMFLLDQLVLDRSIKNSDPNRSHA